MSPDALLAVFDVPQTPSLVLQVGHNHALVLLSLLVAITSSVLAMQTALQMEFTTSRQVRRTVWLAGSVALGLGIWAMHFIGMLALEWSTPVGYHLGLTLLSMVPGMLAAALALALLARPQARAYQLCTHGAAMGAGIGLMHYIGMAALQAGVEQRYDAALFVLSVLLAAGVATAALALRFWLARHMPQLPVQWRNGLAGAVMGLAVASMHYAGMAAVRFVGPVTPVPPGGWNRIELASLLVVVLLLLAGLLMGLGAWARMRQLSRAVVKSEARMRGLMDNLPVIALQIERVAPWRIRLASRRTEALLGQDPALAVGGPLQSSCFWPDLPEQRAALQKALDQLAQTDPKADPTNATTASSGSQRLRLRLTHSNGNPRWFSAVLRPGAPTRRGDPGWIDVTLDDVTDQLASEAALQRAHYIIETSDDAIVSQDLNGRIETWNKGAERLFGYTAQEIIGQSVEILHSPTEVERNAEERRLMKAGVALRGHESIRRHKNGTLLHVLVSSAPIRDGAGRLQGTFKIVHDISDRIRNEGLRKEKERAEQAATLRANFLANMSHELRTPMTAVLGFTSVLMETPLNEEQTRHVRAVHDSARALLGLLNDILDTAKLDRGALQLEVAAFSLDDVLRELDQTLGQKARRKGLRFVYSPPQDGSHLLVGDAARVRQILANLVDNAIKFTEKGEVSVRASTGPDGLTLEVKDTGIGMNEEYLSRLFEPFTQADATHTRRYGGTGLGTTLCKQLVDLMQGTIAVRSKPGVGSLFRVQLPLPVAEALDASERREAGAKKKEAPMKTQPAPLLDAVAGVATWGGQREMWLQGLRMLQEQLPDDVARIHKALSGPTREAIGAVHALRGAAGSLSAAALFQLLDGLETALRRNDTATAQAAAARLDTTARATLRAIEEILLLSMPASLGPEERGDGPARLAGAQKREARRALQQLVNALQHGEIPPDGLTPLQKALGAARPERIWYALNKSLDLYEFHEALNQLQELEQWLNSQPE